MVPIDPALSILIPTRNRAALLERVLRSLEVAQSAAGALAEIVVVDNGSTDDTAALLADWAQRGPRRVSLFVGEPGRSRALNRALPLARGPLLAFTDDDVEVAPNWTAAIVSFFAANPQYHAAMGRVRLPPDVTDADVLARAARFPGTLPLFDAGDSVRELHEMWGCNMVVRRHVFEQVGGYDERLGVGASGLCEDTELSERMRRAGMRIGYMPDAIVYHAVDPSRLTLESLRDFHVRWARSRFIMEPRQPWSRSLLRLVDATISFAWWSTTGQQQRRLAAWARMVRHRELFRLRWVQPRVASLAPGRSERDAPA